MHSPSLKRGGLLEEMVMNLDGMEWDVGEEAIEFRDMVIYRTFRRITLSYTVKQRDGHWMITYLGTE